MLGLCLVGALPVAVGQVEPAPAASAQEICRRLIEESREVDRLLDKISATGINSLTEEELATLRKVREQMNHPGR